LISYRPSPRKIPEERWRQPLRGGSPKSCSVEADGSVWKDCLACLCWELHLVVTDHAGCLGTDKWFLPF
jgi:hypothetical protein